MSASAGHLFALYSNPLPILSDNTSVWITDADMYHRMTHILRLAVGERVILFDQSHSLVCEVIATAKKAVQIHSICLRPHVPLTPEIHWFLPILERDAFEDALSHATVMGVTSITPVITSRSQQVFRLRPERMEKIMAAAAEQSKQFIFPKIRPEIRLVAIPAQIGSEHPFILFDDQGGSIHQVLGAYSKQAPKQIYVCSGPEGGFEQEEILLLESFGAQRCVLTPTILRAWVAVSLGAGLLRSWFKKDL